jgi:NCAIR mutase (PurE)-related protein
MLAAFSRELAEHRADVVCIMTGHAKHVDAILDRVQGLVDENARLREDNTRLEALLVAEQDGDRPSVVNVNLTTAKGSDHPSLSRALLKPTTAGGLVVRLVGAGVAGIGAGVVFLIYLLLGKR